MGSGVENIYSQAFANCPVLTDVYCYVENVPSTSSDAFADSYINSTTLHVPKASINAYKDVEPWKSFKTIMGMEGTLPDNPNPEKKCATPTIAFKDGKLKFSCETEGVKYVTEVIATEAKMYYSDEVALGGRYKVSVYATKTGWENSDVATKEFTVGSNGEVCDVNQDGAVDVADIAAIIDKMASSSRQQTDEEE